MKPTKYGIFITTTLFTIHTIFHLAEYSTADMTTATSIDPHGVYTYYYCTLVLYWYTNS